MIPHLSSDFLALQLGITPIPRVQQCRGLPIERDLYNMIPSSLYDRNGDFFVAVGTHIKFSKYHLSVFGTLYIV